MTDRVAARFWAKVSGADVDSCWEWTAASNVHGYGAFWDGERVVRAHRWSYEALRSNIPEGLVLDHLCRNRACVNPWHLEPVTDQVNAERGAWGIRERCPSGHAYDDTNTGRRKTRRGRECITCRRALHEERRQSNRRALEADPTLAPHGSLNTYNDWMCRCQPCRDAMAAYQRERKSRRHVGVAS